MKKSLITPRMNAFCKIAEKMDKAPQSVTPREHLFFMAFLMPTFVRSTTPGNGDAKMARHMALKFSKLLKPFKNL